MKILKAAGVIIDGAIAVLQFAKPFTVENTPESAVIVAPAVDVQQYLAHSIDATAFVGAAVAALTTFAFAESRKDAAQAKAA